MQPNRPFSIRRQKPFWLLICPRTGRTAVYGVFGDLVAEQASDDLVAFAMANFKEITRWRDLAGPTVPKDHAEWMEPPDVDNCFLFALRDLDSSTAEVTATPDW